MAKYFLNTLKNKGQCSMMWAANKQVHQNDSKKWFSDVNYRGQTTRNIRGYAVGKCLSFIIVILLQGRDTLVSYS